MRALAAIVAGALLLAAGAASAPAAAAAPGERTCTKKLVRHVKEVRHRHAHGRRHRHRRVVRRLRRVCPTVATPIVVAPDVPGVTTPAPAPGAVAGDPTGAAETAPAPGSPPAPPAPARLQVVLDEFSLSLSRPSVVAGPVIVSVVNLGEDPHDLAARPDTGTAGSRQTSPEVEPEGGVGTAELTLGRGTWILYCTLPGHEAAGMRARLTTS